MPPPVEHANKSLFLDRIRGALGHSSPLDQTPDHPSLKATLPRQQEKVRTLIAKNEARRSVIMSRLATTAEAASWQVHRVNTPDGAAATVAEIVSRATGRSVVRTAEDIFKRVDIDGALRRRNLSATVLASSGRRKRGDLKRLAFDADIGISGVTYAVAETASCVVTPRKGVARIATLAPPVLVLLVEAEQVIETLDDFFALTRLTFQQSRGRSPNYFNFISGPSRTADIEQTLTIGVHGPGEVHMVLIG